MCPGQPGVYQSVNIWTLPSGATGLGRFEDGLPFGREGLTLLLITIFQPFTFLQAGSYSCVMQGD